MKPGSLSLVPGTASNPALVTHAYWPMLHWSCKKPTKGSLAALRWRLGTPNYRLEAALCRAPNTATAELEEATLTENPAQTLSAWECVWKPLSSQELRAVRSAVAWL